MYRSFSASHLLLFVIYHLRLVLPLPEAVQPRVRLVRVDVPTAKDVVSGGVEVAPATVALVVEVERLDLRVPVSRKGELSVELLAASV